MAANKVVCDTAKVRFFKQITTHMVRILTLQALFAILQKYDFSSKSQLFLWSETTRHGCLRYCKSTIFQANHNSNVILQNYNDVVCDTAKVRFFKQITTYNHSILIIVMLFAILQKYDFSSKSQLVSTKMAKNSGCLRYCKSTIFQANHN